MASTNTILSRLALASHAMSVKAGQFHTTNKPFSAWGEIFGDDVAAAAMIDRLVHHAEILALKGDSYHLKDLKDRDLARPPAPTD